MDLSKYSDDELEKIVNGQNASSKSNDGPGLIGSPFYGDLPFTKSLKKGFLQGVGDLGASALNAPISAAEWAFNTKLPHVPHPHLINEHPSGLSESVGQTLGQLGSGFALPGGAAVKGAQYANKLYKGYKAGKELPLIGKLLAGTAGGAAEGGLGSEGNRMQGAGIGALLGAGAQGAQSAYNLFSGLKSKNIAKAISEEVGRLGEHFNERFTSHLAAGEEAGANKFLRPEKAKIPLLKKAGEGKLAYGIEKFNAEPTLTNAHKAQSDLNKIITKYARSKEGSLESDVYSEALRLKNRLLQKISQAFEQSGTKEHGAGYQQSRVDYAKEMAPYLESPAIQGLLGKNRRGVQTVRPSQFADKLLKEEEFLAQAGNKHPELLQRERVKSIAKHPASKLAGVALASYLPYEIRKLFGH